MKSTRSSTCLNSHSEFGLFFMRRGSAFTLIELLVVITIIGILTALAIGPIQGALTQAQKVQARNDVTQLVTAISSFEAEYGRYPSNSSGTVDPALVACLTANTNVASTLADNPRQVNYMEFRAARSNVSGTNQYGLVDPWKQTVPFSLAMDTNYANSILVSTNGQLTGTIPIQKRIGVWNAYSTYTPTNVYSKSVYQVRSWD